MFNGNFRHPLDNLIHDDRLFMMEAILPFVPDNMKAPLAMYIKIMELQSILSSLRDKSCLDSCGFHKDINNQDDILSSLADCGFTDVQSQFANIKKMMDMMKIMEASNEMSNKMTKEMPNGMADKMSGGAFADKGMFSNLFGGSSPPENDTGPLYERYKHEYRENENVPNADECQPDHDIHNSNDLYGSIRDLFDEYDQNHL